MKKNGIDLVDTAIQVPMQILKCQSLLKVDNLQMSQPFVNGS